MLLARLGDWTFWEVWDHGKPSYGFEKVNDETPRIREYYPSLDRAIIAAIGEKYTGPRGGTGVGTAADWFARMIGMDQLVEADHTGGKKALSEALYETQSEDGPIHRRARVMLEGLEARGFTLAVRVRS
jgi:hypothetical protein